MSQELAIFIFYRMLFYNSSPARVYQNMGYTGYKGRLFFCQPLYPARLLKNLN